VRAAREVGREVLGLGGEVVLRRRYVSKEVWMR
jgi:hypothetical protein